MRYDTAERKQMTTKKTIRARPFSAELNMAAILEKVWDVQNACGDIQWADDQLDDILGDDLANQFRLQYSDLGACCEQLINELGEYRDTWNFVGDGCGDSYWDAMVAASGAANDLVIYDEAGDGDYTPLWGWTEDYYRRIAEARIKNLTKDKIIELIGDVVWLLKNYWDITMRYQLLAGIFDLVREEACQELDTVKGIEEAWTMWIERKDADSERRLDRLTRELPGTVWLY